MKRKFTARVWQEDGVYIAQCVELELASQGDTEDDAVGMLRDAIELYLSEPDAGAVPEVTLREVEVDAT
ncbi:type II toxin-antitoxin system HicB family antitoxin [Candidatus Poribacteria bacterium]|nr:type II toxin-antitoxin system HicB family antitoxin [Candidatus Poribacteria bacterium]